MDATKLVGFEIPCFKCQAAWFRGIVNKTRVRWLLEEGRVREAAWLYLTFEFREKY